MKILRWLLISLCGIILFPIFLVIALIVAIVDVYQAYLKVIKDDLNNNRGR